MGSAASTPPAPPVGDQRFNLGTFMLTCGQDLPEAHLSYRVIGELNADRSNLVLMPTSYGAWPEDLAWTVGPILDPHRWCVVVVSQFGNGRSSSPSHGHLPVSRDSWPVDHTDNLRAQIRLLEEVFRVEAPALIYGWSMGAQQAYHWAALEPDRVGRICCLCGTARTTTHNRLFLLSLRQALTADPHWNGSGFSAPPLQGLRTFALIYDSWAASQSFYRQGGHLQLGHASVEEYVEQAWLPAYARHDPRDLIGMLDVWLANDLGVALHNWRGEQPRATATDEAGLAAALGLIRARTCVIAGSHDLYFTPEDCAAEAALISDARFTVLSSEQGHRAGNPRDAPREQALIRSELEALWTD
ncbi:MAG: alpha/beta fold hydrolase [Cyanobium sp.]